MKAKAIVLIASSLFATSTAFADKPEVTFDSLVKGGFGVQKLEFNWMITNEGAAIVPEGKVKQAYWSTYEGPLNPIEMIKGSVNGKKYVLIPNIEILAESIWPEGLWLYLETNAKDKDSGLPVIEQSGIFFMGIPTLEYTVNEGGDFCSDGFANATVFFKYQIGIVNWITSDFGHFVFGEPLTDDFPCEQEITFTGHLQYVEGEFNYLPEEDLSVTFSSD